MSKFYFIHDNVSIKDMTINNASALLFLYAFLQRISFQSIDNKLVSILISMARNIGEILISEYPRQDLACIKIYQLTIIIGSVFIMQYAYFLSFL